MADEEKTTQEEITAEDYLTNLQNLRDNTVSKEEYEKVVKEKKQLATALANGYYVEPEKPKEVKDINELRKKLFGDGQKKTTDLQFFTDVLDLRDAVIDAGGVDPFLPMTKDYVPTGDDISTAERVAQNLRECVNGADGDPRWFTNELQRRCGQTRKMR